MPLIDFSKVDFTASPFGSAFTQPFFPKPPSIALSAAQKAVITGKKLDDDFASATINSDIAVFIGGQILAGCKNIEGPFLTTVGDAGFVNHIVSPFAVAVPEATREISSIRWNGTESLTSSDGGVTFDPVGSVFDDVEVTWLPGSETQTPFASSISRYGDFAVPYRSHLCVEFQNIPLATFANVIPFASIYVYQDEVLTRQEAVERILRYARFDDSEFEVNVSGEDVFWVMIGQETVFEFFQSLQRSVGRNWNIVATDKLRVFENSSTVTPIEVTRDDVAVDSVRFWQDSPETVPADRILGFVDTDGDNAFNTVKVPRARFPIPLTSSQNSQQLDLPIGMGRLQAQTICGNSLLIDQFALDKCSFKLLPHMRGVEPGDILELDFDQAFPNWRVLSIARNAADFTSDAVCERIELSLLTTGPSITSNGGEATASITIDENTTAVTTVTSDQVGTFSIAGGDDSSFFSINPTTGVLTITARDFEDPQDSDLGNDYEVTVQVVADGLAGTQVITVTVVNVADAGDAPIMDFSDEENSQLLAVLDDF